MAVGGLALGQAAPYLESLVSAYSAAAVIFRTIETVRPYFWCIYSMLLVILQSGRFKTMGLTLNIPQFAPESKLLDVGAITLSWI